MIDFLILGSGPAGVAAAHALRNTNCVVLDPGFRPERKSTLSGDLFEIRRSNADLFDELIGENFESLHNIHKPPVSAKLKAPGMRFITKGEQDLSPMEPGPFDATMSFASGGLANAWGAGVYRYTDTDLESFPIRAQDLDTHYNELTELMGIAGADDDLGPWFGEADTGLLPPLRVSAFYAEMLALYQKKRQFMNARGIFLGHSRLAVLTRPWRGRPAYAYDNLDFFRARNLSVYNPAFTLEELVTAGAVRYERGCLATCWKESETFVEVTARNLASGSTETFRARHVLVAAGALNTGRLALASAGDTKSHLPILDNAMSVIPLVRLRRFGSARDSSDSPLGQLNMIYAGPESPAVMQATLYGTAGPLRSDFALEFPLPLRASLEWARCLTPALGFAILFYPDYPTDRNYMQLTPSGSLRVTHEEPARGPVERELIRTFRRLGYLSSMRICRFPRIGSGLHYSGCLPMKSDPGPFETRPDGGLYGSKRVYVVDGAVFPQLPSKNLTFTIMANAMRVASALRVCG